MKRSVFLLSIALLYAGFVVARGGQGREFTKLQPLSSWARLQTLIGHTESVHSVAFSPDGKMVASAAWDRSVIVWDVETGAKKLIFKHGYHPHKVIFSPDGNFLYSSGGDGTVKRWDLKTGR